MAPQNQHDEQNRNGTTPDSAQRQTSLTETSLTETSLTPTSLGPTSLVPTSRGPMPRVPSGTVLANGAVISTGSQPTTSPSRSWMEQSQQWGIRWWKHWINNTTSNTSSSNMTSAEGDPTAASPSVIGLATAATTNTHSRLEDRVLWLWQSLYQSVRFGGGIFGVIFVVAWVATIPIVQLLALGFLVEVTHRVANSGRLRDAIVGREKGWYLFKMLLGVGISLVPLLVISRMRQDAWLISPASNRYTFLLRTETLLFALTALHLLGAGLCGAKLRHFLWPILLPWYLTTGMVKKIFRWSPLKTGIQATVGRWFPQAVASFYQSRPLSQWFVPMVVWKHLRQGTLISEASQRFWQFAFSLRLVHYARIGLGSLIGLTVWFAGPTFWVLTSTRSMNPGIQGIFYLFFLVHLFLVLLYFPLVHARYCATLNIRSYFQYRKASRTFRYSPFRFTVALMFSLLLSTPLWLMRIAMIPYDLWWILAMFYVGLLWPTWALWGWAMHYGSVELRQSRDKSTPVMSQGIPDKLGSTLALSGQPTPCRFSWVMFWRVLFWALVLVQLLLTVASIYLCWQGSFNLMMHPMFHIPTPFGPNA